jgi:hypothetical protein
MAKEQVEDKSAAKVEKAVAAALKSERARVKKAIANVEWPEGTAVRAQYDIKRALNTALAAN